MSEMKAIHFKKGGGKASECLELQTLPKPDPEEHDLLIRLKACAVNPVDTKIRQGEFPASDVTGFDAAGVVEAIGSRAQGTFNVGDEVYYSGCLGRKGSTAQYQLVDYRLAALKPKNLDWVDAAAIPLVSITAWELFEEHFNLQQDDPSGKQSKKSMLIINGAGGVGSIGTQLARRVFKLGKVIVTASRPETIGHAKKMGATHVINHHKDLKEQLKTEVRIETVDYIMICYSTNSYMDAAIDLASPMGKIGSIVEIQEPLQGMHKPDAFMKALSFYWEFMLGKSAFNYDLESQGDMLKRVAHLYETGVLQSLVSEQYTLSVKTLVDAHEKLESGKTIGKIALKIDDDIQ